MTDAAARRRSGSRAEVRVSELSEGIGPSPGPRGDSSETNELLRALLAVNGRVAFPEQRLRSLVSATGSAAYLQAYRMCNGFTSLTDIAKEVGLDLGNLSRVVAKWVEAGIAFRVGAKRVPLHLYPLPVEDTKPRAPAKELSGTPRGGRRMKVAGTAAVPQPDVDRAAPASGERHAQEE